MISAAIGAHDEQVVGDVLEESRRPERVHDVRDQRDEAFLAVDCQGPRVTELIPSVMISGLTRKIATPIPLTSPIPKPEAEREEQCGTVPWACAVPEVMNAPAVAVVATERSTPPVSMTSV